MPQMETELAAGALPYSLEAEQSVLGAMLIDADCVPRVMQILSAESFYRRQHREIFSIMLRMFTSSEPVDFITVLEKVQEEEVFASDDEAKIYLTQLVEVVPTTSNVEYYAGIIRDKAHLRSLIQVAQEIIDQSADGHGDAGELLDSAEQKIFDIRQGREVKGLVRIDEIILETYDRLQKLNSEERDKFAGVSSGFSSLDHITTGLNPSDLILIAARPAMGKTSFALNIAANVAKAGRTVAIFSLEMSKEQLVSRMLSSEALIDSNLLRTGALKSEDWVKLAMSAQVLGQTPVYIDDTPAITVGQMKAKLRRLKGLSAVFIDYLQLMSSGRRIDNRVQEISEITRSLKIMAKELNVPVIALSQLSRGVESRSDHRPVLSDLRDSGSIEQDADQVLFLYRDEYYNPEGGEVNTAECIVAKNRHGETNTVKLGWDGAHTRFKGLELVRREG